MRQNHQYTACEDNAKKNIEIKEIAHKPRLQSLNQQQDKIGDECELEKLLSQNMEFGFKMFHIFLFLPPVFDRKDNQRTEENAADL